MDIRETFLPMSSTTLQEKLIKVEDDIETAKKWLSECSQEYLNAVKDYTPLDRLAHLRELTASAQRELDIYRKEREDLLKGCQN
jgi:hypothetical protein